MAESNSLDFNDSAPQTNSSEGQHHDNPVSTTSSGNTDCQSEKSKYNKNGSLSIPWQFTSVYTHRFPDGTPEVTTCHSKACCNVDYIFYTATGGRGQTTENKKHEQKGELTLLGRLRLMKKSYFDTMRLLPNRIFSSDHLSLQARFKLTWVKCSEKQEKISLFFDNVLLIGFNFKVKKMLNCFIIWWPFDYILFLTI